LPEDVPVVAEVVEEIVIDIPATPEELQVGSEGDAATRIGTSGRRPAYSGRERRRTRDASYGGPERRMATL
jgi:hypothetical protein